MTLKFRDKLILLVMIPLLIAGAAYFLVSVQLADNIKKDITGRIERSNTTYEEFTKNYFELLIRTATSVSDNPKFSALLSTNDSPTILQGLKDANENIQANILMALGAGGQVLATIDESENMRGINMSQIPEIGGALSGYDNGGFWTNDGHLFWIAAAPSIVDNQILGVVVLGYEVNDNAAATISKVTGSEISFVLDKGISATSLPDLRAQTLAELQNNRASLDSTILQKSSSRAFTFMLGQEMFIGVASPVFGAPERPGEEPRVLAPYVFFTSLDKALLPLRESQRVMLYVGIALSIVALVIASFFIGGISRPVRQLVEAMHDVSAGNLDREVQVTSKDEIGSLALSFNEMTKGLKQKERVEGLFGKYLSPDVAKKVLAEQSLDGILKGEKSTLSVMFTDIRGFTPMSRGMDPQELINLLNSHFDESIDIIDRYGGTLDKFIGDAIMAFFGAPVHYEDFYMRAINAAVQMQRATEKFNFQRKVEGKEPIHIGIGINTGDVVVGNIGSNKRLEYTVIGETVNLANRQCSVAKKGQVIISQSTYDLLPNKSIASPIDQVTLKGISEPVTVYEVVWKS